MELQLGLKLLLKLIHKVNKVDLHLGSTVGSFNNCILLYIYIYIYIYIYREVHLIKYREIVG
jgi:hypothetical protein